MRAVDALVTGGTGFVGANLVRELLADGHTVRVLARPGSDRRALDGCQVEIAEGDLLDAASLARAVAGARHVYHAAADYRLWAPDLRALYRANVDGTRHLLAAAAEHLELATESKWAGHPPCTRLTRTASLAPVSRISSARPAPRKPEPRSVSVLLAGTWSSFVLSPALAGRAGCEPSASMIGGKAV